MENIVKRIIKITLFTSLILVLLAILFSLIFCFFKIRSFPGNMSFVPTAKDAEERDIIVSEFFKIYGKDKENDLIFYHKPSVGGTIITIYALENYTEQDKIINIFREIKTEKKY